MVLLLLLLPVVTADSIWRVVGIRNDEDEDDVVVAVMDGVAVVMVVAAVDMADDAVSG